MKHQLCLLSASFLICDFHRTIIIIPHSTYDDVMKANTKSSGRGKDREKEEKESEKKN
jgi:hypothetical protein